MMLEERERELRELKQTTSKLKSKIPFNFITPPVEEDQLAGPNVNLQSPTHPSSNPFIVSDELLFNHNFSLYDSYRCLGPLELSILRCFLAFPIGAFIKASLLCHLVHAVLSVFFDSKDIVSLACEFVSKGFIKSVYKKHSSATVDGFLMDPSVHRTLRVRVPRAHRLQPSLVSSSSIDGEDIIYSGSAESSTLPFDLKFLHLGTWQSSPTHHNIEMPDPNLYFKYAGDMYRLEYISFRGVSVMKELPDFITRPWDLYGSSNGTKLENLRILDLKACHHLEIIPSGIGNLQCLTHLDMSECYFLDHMPASLARLTALRVLKGFFVGETNINEVEESCCTLQDLSSMAYLVKLHIYTSLKTFRSENHLTTLQRFRDLHNLTICWGGCPTKDDSRELRPPRKSTAIPIKRLVTREPDHPVVRVDEKFSFILEKLDLRGAPENGTPNWLRPSYFEKLEKLYIRGGKLKDLRHVKEAQIDNQIAPVEEKKWRSVKVLRLRHLSKLKMDWSEVQDSFPNVVSLEKVECPNLTSFPCDEEDGLWRKETTQPAATSSF